MNFFWVQISTWSLSVIGCRISYYIPQAHFCMILCVIQALPITCLNSNSKIEMKEGKVWHGIDSLWK